MTITLYYNQLAHTIMQVAHRAGQRQDDADLRAQAQLDDSTSDQQLIRRLIRTGIGRLKVLLRDYITNGAETADDKLDTAESWVFNLSMTGDGQSLADIMHWFVAWGALKTLAPTLCIDGLEEAADENATEAEDLITDELVSLSMPVKRRRAVLKPQDFSPNITLV